MVFVMVLWAIDPSKGSRRTRYRYGWLKSPAIPCFPTPDRESEALHVYDCEVAGQFPTE